VSGSLYQYVFDQLQIWRGDWAQVSAGSGISLRTIEKIGYGTATNPRVKTVEPLAAFFRSNPRRKAA
jgi:hypothetical protein